MENYVKLEIFNLSKRESATAGFRFYKESDNKQYIGSIVWTEIPKNGDAITSKPDKVPNDHKFIVNDYTNGIVIHDNYKETK
jgi:hypothetical protein